MTWRKSGLPLTISVNLSAKQFYRDDLAERICEIVREVGCDRVTVLADTAIRGHDLDEAKASEAKRLAEDGFVVALGMPTRSVETTCAYCGVGCSFKAEIKGSEVVRMVPYKDGGANEGHSCVKGRFAHQYARSPERLTSPMMRHTDGTWRETISAREPCAPA